MICFPNAKINLGLNVVSKREDGYHNLETIFYPIMIKDALEIIVSDKGEDSFIESGIKTTLNTGDNLVMKALILMRKHYDIPSLEINLLKKIPFGAGIGGGSADASFMLKLLNNKFSLDATDSDLVDMAAQLGADCPFFIHNRPLFAQGTGNIFQEIDLSLQDYYLILVKPDIHISTKDAFLKITPQTPNISLIEISKSPVSEWKNTMLNDFEKSILPKYPVIQNVKDKLYALGAEYASMTGTGSSVYGIFKKKTDLKHHFADCFVWEQE